MHMHTQTHAQTFLCPSDPSLEAEGQEVTQKEQNNSIMFLLKLIKY